MADLRTPGAERVLWRMQGPARIIRATLVTIGGSTELRVCFEPGRAEDLLSRQLETRGYRAKQLERRAKRLRDALREQGWKDLEVAEAGTPGAGVPDRAPRPVSRLLTRTAVGLGLAAAAGLWWRRRKPPS